MFEEDSQSFGEGEDELPMGQPQQQPFAEVFGKKKRTPLRARRTEVKPLTTEGTKVIVATVRIGAADAGDAVGVIATGDEAFGDLLDALESELPVLLSVALVVGVDKGREVLDEQVLQQILSPWDIAPRGLGLQQRQR